MPQTTLSGPELSVEVARCVMGWERAGIVNGKCYVPCGQGYWAPHEFIKDAWEVVEKVQANGWTFHVDDVGFNNGIEGKWRVLLTEAETGDKHVFADGDTAPHAICLAALKAMSATTKSVSS